MKTALASRPATLSPAHDNMSVNVSCRSGHVRSCSFLYQVQARDYTIAAGSPTDWLGLLPEIRQLTAVMP